MQLPDGNAIPPTNKKFSLTMATLGHWTAEGLMDEEYLFWDNAAFMKQIGLGQSRSLRYAGGSTRSPALLGGCPRNSTHARFAQGSAWRLLRARGKHRPSSQADLKSGVGETTADIDRDRVAVSGPACGSVVLVTRAKTR